MTTTQTHASRYGPRIRLTGSDGREANPLPAAEIAAAMEDYAESVGGLGQLDSLRQHSDELANLCTDADVARDYVLLRLRLSDHIQFLTDYADVFRRLGDASCDRRIKFLQRRLQLTRTHSTLPAP